MTWRDTVTGQGSYRGAAFYITDSRAQFGRRNKVNEYPQRDAPYTEDLGRAARRWNIECFVVGDDYMTARDALIAALEGKGGGTLVHPYLGTVTASVEQPAQVTESTAGGGMASFSLQFVETGVDNQPTVTVDTQAASVTANLQETLTQDAPNVVLITNQPTFVASSALGVLAQAKSAMSQALAAINAPADALFSAQQQLQAFTTQGLSLLEAPASLVAGVFSTVSAIGALAPYADDALTALCGPFIAGPLSSGSAEAQPLGGLLAFGAALPAVPLTTPARQVQANNQTALTQMVQCAAAAAAVTTVSQIDFTSYDDAAGIRDALADQLDQLATAVSDSGAVDVAVSIDALRLAMIADVTARGASLARLYSYTPPTTQPMVVIAQRLYGDATQTEALLARNFVFNPGFTPGGRPLEVLSNV